MVIPRLIGQFTAQEGALEAPYWAGLAVSELRLQRCASCRVWIWGPQWRCGQCGSWDLGWEIVDPTGRMFSWTRTWHPVAPELADDVPYTVVLVTVDGTDGRRVLGIWLGDDDPNLDEAVEVAWPAAGAERANPHALAWRAR